MYKIIDIHEDDAYFNMEINENKIVGMIGDFENPIENNEIDGFLTGRFTADDITLYFYAIKVEKV